MNIHQFKAILPNMGIDEDVAVLQANVIKRSHPGKRMCEQCAFCKQEQLCALLVDQCDGFHYEILKFQVV